MTLPIRNLRNIIPGVQLGQLEILEWFSPTAELAKKDRRYRPIEVDDISSLVIAKMIYGNETYSGFLYDIEEGRWIKLKGELSKTKTGMVRSGRRPTRWEDIFTFGTTKLFLDELQSYAIHVSIDRFAQEEQ